MTNKKNMEKKMRKEIYVSKEMEIENLKEKIKKSLSILKAKLEDGTKYDLYDIDLDDLGNFLSECSSEADWLSAVALEREISVNY